MMESAIIGSDIQEVFGSATALNILFGWPTWVGVLVTILDSFLFLFIHYFGVRKLEFFFVALVFIMGITFWINMFGAGPDVGQILKGTFVPIIPPGNDAINSAIGMFGAVIMPHNLYLHSALVLTRKINMKSKNAINEANIYNNIESGISLLISFLVTLAVVATFAVYLDKYPDADTGMDLKDASIALVELLGNYAQYVWAIGLLAAGQSSTMTGTYAGQFVMEGFLDFKLPVYQRVLLTRCIAIIPAFIVCFLSPDNLTNMDNILNDLQAIMLPFALIPLLKFVYSDKIMGDDFRINSWGFYIAAAFGFVLFVANFATLFTTGATMQTW